LALLTRPAVTNNVNINIKYQFVYNVNGGSKTAKNHKKAMLKMICYDFLVVKVNYP